jgi:hypothetical protein
MATNNRVDPPNENVPSIIIIGCVPRKIFSQISYFSRWLFSQFQNSRNVRIFVNQQTREGKYFGCQHSFLFSLLQRFHFFIFSNSRDSIDKWQRQRSSHSRNIHINKEVRHLFFHIFSFSLVWFLSIVVFRLFRRGMGAGIDADLRLHVHYSIPFPVTFRFCCLYVDHITV